MKHLKVGIATAALANFMLPVAAFAEESESAAGADILIPKPAEFIPALIIFLIILVILSKLAWPMVLNMMETREKTIQKSMDEAEEIKTQAASTRDEADAVMADARRKASEIVMNARADAEKERERIVADARTEAEDIIEKARETGADEQRRIYANATDTIASLSVSVAGKIVGEQLSADDEKQRELIKKYIAEVGSLNG